MRVRNGCRLVVASSHWPAASSGIRRSSKRRSPRLQRPPDFRSIPVGPRSCPTIGSWVLSQASSLTPRITSGSRIFQRRSPRKRRQPCRSRPSAPAVRRRLRSSSSTPQGNVVQGWGDPSQDISIYPRNPHGIFVDHNDFVWVGTYMHHRVQKFTRDGKLVLTIGTYDKNAGSSDTTFSVAPRASGSIPKPTKRSSPMAIATVASSCSTARPVSTCGTGARTARRPTTRTRPTALPTALRRSSFPRCMASRARVTE